LSLSVCLSICLQCFYTVGMANRKGIQHVKSTATTMFQADYDSEVAEC